MILQVDWSQIGVKKAGMEHETTHRNHVDRHMEPIEIKRCFGHSPQTKRENGEYSIELFQNLQSVCYQINITKNKIFIISLIGCRCHTYLLYQRISKVGVWSSNWDDEELVCKERLMRLPDYLLYHKDTSVIFIFVLITFSDIFQLSPSNVLM